MDSVLTHEEVSELLGAYALDAVGPEEAPAVARHVAECRRCAAELESYRGVAGMLGNAGGEAPPLLWERIAEEVSRTEQPAGGGAGVVELLGGRVSRSAAPRGAGARRRARGGRWPVGGAQWAVGALVAAALVLVGVLGFQVQHLDNRVGQLEANGQQTGVVQAAQAALMDPDAHDVTLASSTVGHAPLAEIAVLPSGVAYLVNGHLPGLSSSRTYQLWGKVGTEFVSLGLLGNDPGDVALQLGTSRIAEFAVTDEPAGGVVQPTSSPLAAGQGLAA